MASKYDPMMVPDVDHPILIEDRISGLRKDVEVRCVALLHRIRELGPTSKGRHTLRLKAYEEKTLRIKQAQTDTYSIHELHGLLKESDTISEEVERLAKGGF